MKIQAARDLGSRLAELANLGRLEEAGEVLSPVLAGRTPFRLLDAVGASLGAEVSLAGLAFLDQLAAQRTMGGWVVIASALRQQIHRDLPGAFEHCCRYVSDAGVWYAADSFGERVPGPALVTHFEPALALLAEWRESPDRWVRRMTGVAVHYWAKQAHGADRHRSQVCALLDLLAPLFSEREMDTIKGVGWGLKTLGRYYPDLAAGWLIQQVERPHRALMLGKALTYLPKDLRQCVLRQVP